MNKMVALSLLLILPATARAEKFLDPKLFDAYKKAVTEKGCAAIPYEAERKVCKSSYDKQEEACVDFSCNLETAETLGEEINKQLNDLKRFDESQRPENQYSSELRASLRVKQEALAELVDSATPKQKRAVQCREERAVVQRAFARAEKRVREEKSYNNKLFEGWQKHIADHFKDGVQGHRTAIEGANAAAERCKEVLRIDRKYYQAPR